MAKFCDNCGSPIIDGSMPFCPKCGAKFPITPSGMQPPPARPPARTPMSREEIFAKAIPFFAIKNYAVQTQTDYLIAFESQKRDVNWIIFVVLCCFGIIGGVIYYYWFTHQHQVTVSLSGTTDIAITCIGNTEQAKKDAAEFMRGI